MSNGTPLIIGIHGLNNKPEPELLEEWWRASIDEGLAWHFPEAQGDYEFRLVYWADVLYDPAIAPEDITEPYEKATAKPRNKAQESDVERALREAVEKGARAIHTARNHLDVLERLPDWVDRGLLRLIGSVAGDETTERAKTLLSDAPVTGTIVQEKFPDLHAYYTDNGKRQAIQNRLESVLLSDDLRGRKTMLIAHSMGSIVAFDVLKRLEVTEPQLELDRLVTIGSPLGLGYVRDKAAETLSQDGHQLDATITPSAVRHWVNQADNQDPVAILPRLGEFYGVNRHGVGCVDDPVHNEYRAKLPNPHKSYGYLRTPELSGLVTGFV